MTRILTSDLLIADIIAPIAGNPGLQLLVDAHKLKPGGKVKLTDEQAQSFADAFAQVEYAVVPGGSSANMLTTLSKLMKGQVDVRFIGIAGEGAHSAVIRQSLADANISLSPDHLPHGLEAVA
ncbi:MAG: hypothetical protein K2Q01_12320, partial [Rickettsiales bacterium]|nr:hypothetical protein [Rickettsiales bacterium]